MSSEIFAGLLDMAAPAFPDSQEKMRIDGTMRIDRRCRHLLW
jgi:hypothetical protein